MMVRAAGLLVPLLWESAAGTVVNGEDTPVTNMNSGGYTFANPNLQAKKQYDTDYGTRSGNAANLLALRLPPGCPWWPPFLPLDHYIIGLGRVTWW